MNTIVIEPKAVELMSNSIKKIGSNDISLGIHHDSVGREFIVYKSQQTGYKYKVLTDKPQLNLKKKDMELVNSESMLADLAIAKANEIINSLISTHGIVEATEIVRNITIGMVAKSIAKIEDNTKENETLVNFSNKY
jgi:hypothetical protein